MATLIIDDEEFRAHPIYRNYHASLNGNVYSDLTSKSINGTLLRNGYRQLILRFNGEQVNVYKHRFIWECFHGVIEPGREIDHINRVRDDNRLINLRLVDHRTNHFNKTNNASVKVEELPEDVVEISSIRDMEFENYFYSPSTQRAYWVNEDADEIVQLNIDSNNAVHIYDTENRGHYISMRTIRANFEN